MCVCACPGDIMMINLSRKLKKEDNPGQRRAFIRDKLLVREVQEMEQNLPKGCAVLFPDPNVLHEFLLTIQPPEGFWKHGKFKFAVNVPEDYNMAVRRRFLCLPEILTLTPPLSLCPSCSPLKSSARPSYGTRIYPWMEISACLCSGTIQ